MRVRRYKVTVTNSEGEISVAYFVTRMAAFRYAGAWRRRLMFLYAYQGLLDPYAYFVIKKWMPKHRAWDFVHISGGVTHLEDLYLNRGSK